jgi:Glyoxalase-like domain
VSCRRTSVTVLHQDIGDALCGLGGDTSVAVFDGVRSVMVFALDPLASARWWGKLLDADVHVDSSFAWIEVAGVEYGFHPVDDDRNPRDGSPVVHWAVDDVVAVRERLLDVGCMHHRGPLRIDGHRQICQLTDPFGLIFGLAGP